MLASMFFAINILDCKLIIFNVIERELIWLLIYNLLIVMLYLLFLEVLGGL